MLPVIADLEATLGVLAESEPDVIDRIVVVEASPEFPGQLVFQPMGDPQMFLDRYCDWMSRYLVLNELHNLTAFVEQLESDGFVPVFAPNTAAILADHERWSAPLAIEGYSLHPFQAFSLNRALQRAREGRDNSERLYFWNWSAGAGKSFCCTAGARALFDSGDIDLVIACTLSKLKINLCRNFQRQAGLRVVINDHAKPETRHRNYVAWSDPFRYPRTKEGGGAHGFVMNYEKLNFDFEALSEATAGKRVLWVLDEGHKLVSDGSHNKARKALDKLTKDCHAIVWPMSATVVGGNPLRFRDVFSLDGRPRSNPLGTKAEFTGRYANEVREIPIKARNGARFSFTVYDWKLPELEEVRHRVADRTMAVRKTDPGVRQQFKGMDCYPEIIQPSDATQELFAVIGELAKEAKDREESLAPHYLALRVAAINPAALLASDNAVAQEIAASHPGLLDAKHSAKIEVLNAMLESIRESQDKAVVFCHWTELGLLPLAKHLTVPHVLHYGTGQSDRESQDAQDRFLTDSDITCFASSDAGTHGLNLQVARYVINVDPTYSYDDLAQRNARIDRADSHLDGLTAWVLITEGSVEERVWNVCNKRRKLSAAVQGTQEELSYGDGLRNEMDDLDYLVLGEQ